ncbi:cytochrome P450 [Pyronema omphalodes]|nr:cytochrome P450 [Pyronema omphalodes]
MSIKVNNHLVHSILALIFHRSILYREVDFYILQLSGVFLLFYSCIGYTFHHISHYPLQLSILKSISLASTFITTLTISILLHRAFFHRLRHYPGPFWARITKFYAVRKAWISPRSYEQTAELHAKYGPIVRVGPRELSILDAAAIPAIYGSTSACIRGPFHNLTSPEGKGNIFNTRDKATHAVKRRAWDRALNTTSVASYTPRVEALVSLLLRRLAEAQGEPVDWTRLARFLAFDIIGEIGLGRSFGGLKEMRAHPAVEELERSVWWFGVPGLVPWLVRAMADIPGMNGSMGAFRKWADEQMQDKLKAGLKTDKEHKDILSCLLSDEVCGYGKIPLEASSDDTRLVVIAGSDTTSAAISSLFFYLAHHPTVYNKLYTALSSTFPSGQWNPNTPTPYLDAVINETLRLQPPVPSGLVRTTPKEGLTFNGTYIPGDIHVSVPTWSIHRDPRYWDRANEFWPERWLEGNTSEARKAWIPFTTGIYSCTGKNLAYLEMRMVVARVVMRFKCEMTQEMRDADAWEGKIQDLFMGQNPKLWLKFQER